MLVEDVVALRKQVDLVIVALHFGVIRIPRIVADYQVIAAHACIDAGADLIVGHGPHIPKAIEVYRDKAIFYSLGVFCMTRPVPSAAWRDKPWLHGTVRNYADLDPEYPLMPYGRDTKLSMLAKIVASRQGIQRVSFLPMMIDKQYRPEVLRSSDARFLEVLRYLEWASEGFAHRFAVEEDEVVVTA